MSNPDTFQIPNTEPNPDIEESLNVVNPGLIKLLLVAAFAGAILGLIGGTFRWLLTHGGDAYLRLLHHVKVHESTLVSLLLAMCIGFAAVALSRWLIRFAPFAAGSGVQHIEAVMRQQVGLPGFMTLPVKFVGGLLSMVPQLALGREGPTIQMAAVIGSQCGRLFRLNKNDAAMLYTAVSGSGLSVAFNAPLAGALFVIEEVAHSVTTRRLITATIAAATAIMVYRGIFGDDLDFIQVALAAPQPREYLIYALLGFLMGWLGMLQNQTTLAGLRLFNSTAPKIPTWVKAGIFGALVGMIAVFEPNWVGGGERQVNMILGGQLTVAVLLPLLVVRWFLGPASYSLGAPGGLFAPLLFLGAIAGTLFADGVNFITGDIFALDPAAFALVAMSALFAGMVRAPITGIILICEMSGSTTLLVPLMVASLCATVVPTLLRNPPIYDSLRIRMLERS